MRIIHHLQRKLHHRFLNKKLKTFQSLPKLSPDQAKTVAVIFEATKMGNRKIVDNFVQKLKNQGKRVTIFAYLNDKNMSNLPFRFFNKKNVNWRGTPNGAEVEKFLSENFDLLYCLYVGKNIPLEYIGAMAKARFKVGPYVDKLTTYDFMIDTQNTDLQYFINQINFYLTKITKNQNELSTI